MNKALLEIFLSYCERGVSIDFKNKLTELPTKFLSKFDYMMKNNKFVIFNELEENEIFVIDNLDQCKVEEYDECFIIHTRDNTKIIIEELI